MYSLPPRAQSRRGRIGGSAFASVGRAARADQRHQFLVVAAADRAGAGDDTDSSGRAGITFGTGHTSRPGRSHWALRAGFAALTGGACRPLRARFALRSAWTDLALRPGRAGLATLAGHALRSGWSLRALRSLRAGRADRTGWSGLAYATRNRVAAADKNQRSKQSAKA